MTEETLDIVRGGLSDAEPCPYLPDRSWRNFIVDPGDTLDPDAHERLLDAGFRRMGRYLYRPVCEDCTACRSLRIDVNRFRPSKSQRRANRKNADLTVETGSLEYTEEKRELLERYLDARHDGPMTAEEEATRAYMFHSTCPTFEVRLRSRGRLVGVGVVDVTPSILSSLYFFFDPDEAHRSLGTFSILREIEVARGRGCRWYHPGFWVQGCQAMEYKSRFGPSEVLHPDGVWR